MAEMSDPEFLSNDEVLRQQSLMADMREQHQRELMESGSVSRLIGSSALSNTYADRSTFTEGTFVYPSRKRVGWLRGQIYENLITDLGFGGTPESHEPLVTTMVDSRVSPSWAFVVSRFDYTDTNGSNRSSGYMLGVQLSAEAHEIAGTDTPLLPVAGIAQEDLVLVARQLGEIAALKDELNLTLISSETLAEDPLL
jgi:hypothetical protein